VSGPKSVLSEYIGASEWLFIVGVFALFGGFWLWMGIGVALACVGVVMIITAWLNGLTQAGGGDHVV